MTQPEDRGPGRTRERKWIALVLVVVTSIATMASVTAVWAHHTLFDTDAFIETIQPVLQDPAFTDAVGDLVTDEITGALALEERLQQPLANLDAYLTAALLAFLGIGERGQDLLEGIDRPTLEALAGPIADRFNQRIADTVDEVMSSPEVAVLVPRLLRRAHEGTVALVRGDLEEIPNVSIEEGEVRLSLLPLIRRVLDRVVEGLRGLLPDLNLPDFFSDAVDEAIGQFRESLGEQVPEDFGLVTVMTEDRLTEIQDTAATLDRWVWGIVILTLVLIGLTIWVSPTRRRTAIQLGIGIIVAFVVGILLVRRLETAILEQILSPEGAQAAIGLLEQVLESLREAIIAVIVIAALVTLGLHIAGRPRWATATGEWVGGLLPGDPGAGRFGAWVAAHYDIVRIVLVAAAVLTLFLTGLDWIPVLIVVGVLAAALWWLGRVRDRAHSLPEVDSATSDADST